MKSIGSALSEMLEAFHPLSHTTAPLREARDRVTCVDVLAQHDLPGFDNSAMDGYAVRSSDVATAGVTLPVVGESRAGGELPAELSPGSAMRIFTGAPMPAGADSVIIQENSERNGAAVQFLVSAAPGSNVRLRGSDLHRGEVCIPAGTVIDAGAIGMLASQGLLEVPVHRRPKVAIVATGDELREPGETLPPGAIYNSNAHALAAAVESVGAEAWILPIARDNAEDLGKAFNNAFTADVVVCCGGVSVGEYDLVDTTLQQLGVELRFHKVAMKPGKPLLFAMRGTTPFVGLPGNPVSSWVAFELFMRPCLRRMLGHSLVHPRTFRVKLGHSHTRSMGRVELARARLTIDGDTTTAHLIAQQGSGSLPSLVAVDALVVFPADQAAFPAGSELTAVALHEARGHATPALG